MAEARAIAKHIRIAPRKLRIVVDLIRGKDIGEAYSILKFTPILGGLIGVIACFLPVFLIMKLDLFKAYRSWKLIFPIFMGIVLCLSPFISLLQ